MFKIVNAFSACQGTFSAGYLTHIIKEVLESKIASPIDVLSIPIADSVDGTLDAILRYSEGELVTCKIKDPLGRVIESTYGTIDSDNTAIIEMAKASGMALLKEEELNPFVASSYGTGELIKHALGLGVKRIVLGVGGSATVDGGSGMLQALGVRFIDSVGEEVKEIPERLNDVAKIDTSGLLKELKDVEFHVLCDVENVLIGRSGGVAVYSPQKGAQKEDLALLEERLVSFFSLLGFHSGLLKSRPYWGAAGGILPAVNYMNPRVQAFGGTAYIINMFNLEDELEAADVLICGEGRIDKQTYMGKAPYYVASLARNFNLHVYGLCGQLAISDRSSLYPFHEIFPLYNNDEDFRKEDKQEQIARLKETAGQLADQLIDQFFKP